MSHSRINSHKGTIMIEFALVLPIILMISLGAFEISRAIRLVGVASKLSYEVAKVAIKECFDGGEKISVQPFDVCLQEKQEGVQILAESIVPGTKIYLRYYVTNAPVNPSGWKGDKAASKYPQTDSDEFQENLDRTETFIKDNFDKLKEHRKLIVGECFLPYSPLFGFISTFLPFRTSNNYMYDATII